MHNHQWMMQSRCNRRRQHFRHPTFNIRTTQLYQINLNLRQTSTFTSTTMATWAALTWARHCAINLKTSPTTFSPRNSWWWRRRRCSCHRTWINNSSNSSTLTTTWTHQFRRLLSRTCRRLQSIRKSISHLILYPRWTSTPNFILRNLSIISTGVILINDTFKPIFFSWTFSSMKMEKTRNLEDIFRTKFKVERRMIKIAL